MASLVTPLRMLLRLFGLVAIVLGVMVWTGNHAEGNLHVRAGLCLMIVLFLLVLVAATRKVQPVLLLVGLAFVVALPALGFMQSGLLQGSAHWLIQVLHLLVGIGAIGIGEVIGKRAK